jgi:hypothetical protein
VYSKALFKLVEVSDTAWVCKFMEVKCRILHVEKFPLMTVKDWEFLISLTPEQAKKVRSKIEEAVSAIFSGRIDDGGLCPWCILYSCDRCSYAEEHGCCNDDDSDYRVIKNHLVIGNFSIAIRKHKKEFSKFMKPVKVVKSRTDIIRQLLEDGYEMTENGDWVGPSISFSKQMFKYCEKKPISGYIWQDQWVEEKE